VLGVADLERLYREKPFAEGDGESDEARQRSFAELEALGLDIEPIVEWAAEKMPRVGIKTMFQDGEGVETFTAIWCSGFRMGFLLAQEGAQEGRE
jgi:hypothetical protein